MEFYKIYRPVTATPLQSDASYRETLPCTALRPYIRCFWGMERGQTQLLPAKDDTRLIIPDTCMDIIFHISYAGNRISGSFCGIDDAPYQTDGRHGASGDGAVFAIRFYAWSAVLFAEENMKSVCNLTFEAGQYFSKIQRQLAPLLWECEGLKQRAAAAERVLLENFHPERENSLLMDAVYQILRCRGSMKTSGIADRMHISIRQLERICKENTGVSPKKLSSLVRYQYLFQDILSRPFYVLDAVARYGYTDQAHLIRDFKRYHSMLPKEAREKAFSESMGNSGNRKKMSQFYYT